MAGSDAFQRLLEATIQHVERLQAGGVRQVRVDPATVAALGRPVRAVRAAAPRSAAPRPVAGTGPVAGLGNRPAGLPPAARDARDGLEVAATGAEPVPGVMPGADVLPPALDPAAKAAAFQALQQQVLACRTCAHLAAARRNVVFGVGDPDAQLMLVGEAPGAEEDQQGEPFVGAAGQLLTKIILAMGLTRERVYIANVLKCRPDTPGQSAGNRKPTPEEMRTCLPYLRRQIEIIQPRVLVGLGATAIEGLFGRTAVRITQQRGSWMAYAGIPLMPTFHPAYLLRTQSMADKRRVWEDMMAVMERLGMPISEKQRGYFLSAR